MKKNHVFNEKIYLYYNKNAITIKSITYGNGYLNIKTRLPCYKGLCFRVKQFYFQLLYFIYFSKKKGLHF